MAESEGLHARVQAFARAALGQRESSETFEQLALAIARHQNAHNPVLARLAQYHGSKLASLDDVPAVPAGAFRLGRVSTHGAPDDVACFHTSGTTGGAGVHAFRTLGTYRELCVAWGRQALLPALSSQRQATVLALAPPFEPERRSSLGYMMQQFMFDFDGRALAKNGLFEANESGRWLLGPGGVDVPALRRGAELAEKRAEPLLLLATSFALVWLLEALRGSRLQLPPGSRIMQTGGFKGHVRTLDDLALVDGLGSALGVEPANVVGEYGMTELSSQLYDGGFRQGQGGESVFVEPPWLRVVPVDPISLQPVSEGEVGLARFTDLGNVDSALNVLTQDQVRRVPGGLALLGRPTGARSRGCSLAVDELLTSVSGAGGSPT